MKRITILVLLVVLATTSLFGFDLYVGGNAYYASAIQPSDVRNARPAGLALSDFAFAAETRLYLDALTGSAVALFVPGSSFAAPRFRIMTDVGLTLQIPLLRVGLGIGPDFGLAFGDSTQTARLGGNLRLTGDVVLGDLSLGLSWFSLVSFDRQSIADAFRNPYGFLGITLLTRL